MLCAFIQHHFVKLEHFVGVEYDHVFRTALRVFDLVGERRCIYPLESAVGGACFTNIRKEQVLAVHLAVQHPAEGVTIGVVLGVVAGEEGVVGEGGLAS